MSNENKSIIKAINMFGRVPEQWELLEEIERLNKRIEDLNIINEEHQILNEMIRKELQQKENIIKEVREYIEHKASIRECYMINGKEYKELLEILDKENKE